MQHFGMKSSAQFVKMNDMNEFRATFLYIQSKQDEENIIKIVR